MRRRYRLASVVAGLALALCASAALGAPAHTHVGSVALTFDDLPALSLSRALPYEQATTRELLAGLRAHRVPATGFVTESELEGPDKARRIALLQAWLRAGMDLGDHGYSHLSLTSTPVEAYIADVARGEQVTRTLLAARGRAPHWFRHPYLETGPTPQARRAFEAWLADHGYRVAPVTMENADWQFAYPYDAAMLRGDTADAARIRKAYLDYTARIVPWYRQAAIDVLGREPAFVFLLHATRLNADSVDALSAIFRANRLRPVSLAAAMRDPAYAIPDTYAGPDGNGWITRWSLTLGKPMPWSTLPHPPKDIVAEDQRLEAGATG